MVTKTITVSSDLQRFLHEDLRQFFIDSKRQILKSHSHKTQANHEFYFEQLDTVRLTLLNMWNNCDGKKGKVPLFQVSDGKKLEKVYKYLQDKLLPFFIRELNHLQFGENRYYIIKGHQSILESMRIISTQIITEQH